MFTLVKPTPDLSATVFWPLTATEAFDVPELAVFSEETLDLLYPIDTYMEGYTKTVLQKAQALIDDPANFGPFSDDEAGQRSTNACRVSTTGALVMQKIQ